jgi:Zn-dependent protease with chaperone function
MSEIVHSAPPAQAVPRWETEIPLLILVAIAAAGMWFFLFVSIIGIFYGLFFAVFFFLAHVGFIAHLRGSAVKLGPDQMPELYARVRRIGQRLGMEKMPDAYVMQAGGSLNALATKLLGSSFIVLYSDLLDACADDEEAADFVIAHEIGHLKAGHLRFNWFLILGQLIPFLGGAYSRAREYTADRYGFAAIADRRSAIHGLTVLAAGGTHAKKVNLLTFMNQRRDMTGVLMTLGRWMSTHPPIVDRVAEADKALAGEPIDGSKGILGAIALIAFAFLAPMAAGGFFFAKFMNKMQEATQAAQVQQASALPSMPATTPSYEEEEDEEEDTVADPALAAELAKQDLKRLGAVAEQYRAKYGRIPGDIETLYSAVRVFDPTAGELRDPFDGQRYGYAVTGQTYSILSAGNDTAEFQGKLVVRSK